MYISVKKPLSHACEEIMLSSAPPVYTQDQRSQAHEAGCKLLHVVNGCKEGRKEILLIRATTKVDWHVNVWSEQISGPQIYQGKQ